MEEHLNKEPFYRLRDVHYETGITVRLERWYPIKKTPRGTWVRNQYSPMWKEADFKYLKDHKYLKFILDNSNKKYCYPNIEDAINSFRKRKIRQQQKLQYQLEQATVCVENIDKLVGASVESFEEGFHLGYPPSHDIFWFE